jgi:hypothetical protein
MDFLNWLQDSALGLWVRESDWGYPIVLTSHAIGMAIVVGAVLMFDFRILGYAKRLPLHWFDRIFLLAWSGFALNFVSGMCLFAGQPVKFLFHPAFQIKIALIAAGGISIRVLGKQLRNPVHMSASGEISNVAKTTAAASIVFWIGAIVAGRLIAYIN